MKKILPALGIVAVFAACNTKNSAAEQELAILKAKQATIDSMNIVVEEREAKAEEKAVSYAAAVRKSTPARRTTTARRPVQYASYSEPAVLPTATPAPEKKKGWSNKAKGAVIGGVVGAGAGAVIAKDKKAQGAIIGGVVGAAAGYGVGAILDKKSGR
ncbi:MAG TPA: glycine zipper 2TM domain-containing protein [Chitinophagaceae bacterium]